MVQFRVAWVPASALIYSSAAFQRGRWRRSDSFSTFFLIFRSTLPLSSLFLSVSRPTIQPSVPFFYFLYLRDLPRYTAVPVPRLALLDKPSSQSLRHARCAEFNRYFSHDKWNCSKARASEAFIRLLQPFLKFTPPSEHHGCCRWRTCTIVYIMSL